MRTNVVTAMVNYHGDTEATRQKSSQIS
jgi:hypothetical protein